MWDCLQPLDARSGPLGRSRGLLERCHLVGGGFQRPESPLPGSQAPVHFHHVPIHTLTISSAHQPTLVKLSTARLGLSLSLPSWPSTTAQAVLFRIGKAASTGHWQPLLRQQAAQCQHDTQG